MAGYTKTKICENDQGSSPLPVQPYVAVNYHYGMLLGVDDFVTDQSYHRGKMRLHNAWLHGSGVIRGLEVSEDPERNELRVDAGLAMERYLTRRWGEYVCVRPFTGSFSFRREV